MLYNAFVETCTPAYVAGQGLDSELQSGCTADRVYVQKSVFELRQYAVATIFAPRHVPAHGQPAA